MKTVSVVIMGFTSLILQVMALRELLAVFSGNELDIGITLSVWLIIVGVGSWAGSRIKTPNAFALSFLFVALLSQPSLVLIQVIRPLLSAELGETIPLIPTLIFTFLSLAPLCLVIGAQFPLAVSHVEGKAATVYGLEATGAFIGGTLFVFVLSGRTDADTLAAALAVFNIATAALLGRKKALAAALLIPVLFFFGAGEIIPPLQWKGAEFISKTESRYGKIEIVKIRGQVNVYSSGKFHFSYPDHQSEELRAHLSLSIHPSPARVLVIGGSPAVLREFMKYPLSGVDFVELDPEIIRVSLGLLTKEDSKTLEDAKIRIVTTDARRFIKNLSEPPYDLVVLNLPEPSTANINRFYTVEFFRETRAALKQDGIIVLFLPTAFGYVGRRMQLANGSIYNSLKSIFASVEVSSEEFGILIASETAFDADPEALHKRFAKRKIKTEYFHPYMLNDAFSPLKVSMVKARLEKVHALNTDMRPAAYLYSLMVWAEMQGGALLMSLPDYGGRLVLVMIAASAGAAIVLWRKRRGVYYSLFTTGCSAMAFSLIIILAYQARFGYVYEMLGLLTATFMAGLALGAYSMRSEDRPLQKLRMLEAATVALFVSSPLFFRQEVFYYLLTVLNGIAAGAEFAAATRFMKERDATGIAGNMYALDLAGSFLGALLTAIILVPLFGIQNTILFVVVLKSISLALLFSIPYEKA